jgi:hypothetical protein
MDSYLYIVACGDISSGYTFFGPFATFEEAERSAAFRKADGPAFITTLEAAD